MSDPVREFLARALTAAGGVVEEAPRGLDALLPPEAARSLGVPEELEIRLFSSAPAGEAAGGVAASGEAAGGVAAVGEAADGVAADGVAAGGVAAVGEAAAGRPNDVVGVVAAGAASGPASRVLDGRIGSAFLERLVSARLERGCVAAVALPAGLPNPLPDSLPVLLNAVRLDRAERRRTRGRFLAAELRLTLEGEDQRSALVPLTLRLEDGARTEPFRVSGAYPVSAPPLSDRERENAARALRSWLWREGPAIHASAMETLRRRARRDLERMSDYYRSLDEEMAKAAGRARSKEERARREAKWAALPAELDGRREQLRVRIQPRLAARIVAATLIDSDVERFEFPVRRRKSTGRVALLCRMADGVFEGPACAACGVATLRLYLCDERLHVLCEACGQDGKLDAARCAACSGPDPEPPRVSVDDPTAALRLGGARRAPD